MAATDRSNHMQALAYLPDMNDTHINDTHINGTYIHNAERHHRSTNLSDGISIFLGLLAGTITMSTILQNVAVILAFSIDRSTRKPSNYFLLSLAVSDLVIGMWSMPIFTHYVLHNVWLLGPAFCNIWLTVDWTVFQAGQYTAFLITIDRYLSIKTPAQHRMWGTKRKVKLVVLLAWVISALIYVTSISFWDLFVPHGDTFPDDYCDAKFMRDPAYLFLMSSSYFLIMLVVMFTLYAYIYRIASRLHRAAVNKVSPDSSSSPGRRRCGIAFALRRRLSDSGLVYEGSRLRELRRVSLPDPSRSRYNDSRMSETPDSTSLSGPFSFRDQNYNESGLRAFADGSSCCGSCPANLDRAEELTSKESRRKLCSAHSGGRPRLSDSTAYYKCSCYDHVIGVSVSDCDCVCELANSCMETDKSVVEERFCLTLASNSRAVESPLTDFVNVAVPDDDNENYNAQTQNEDGKESEGKTKDSEKGLDQNNRPVDNRLLNVEMASVEPSSSGNMSGVVSSFTDVSSSSQSVTSRRRFRNNILRNVKRVFRSREKSGDHHLENRARKAFRMISLILVSHVICMTPFYGTALYMGINGYDSINERFYNFAYWMCYLNSLINPYCYAYANIHFRSALLRVLKFDWHVT